MTCSTWTKTVTVETKGGVTVHTTTVIMRNGQPATEKDWIEAEKESERMITEIGSTLSEPFRKIADDIAGMFKRSP